MGDTGVSNECRALATAAYMRKSYRLGCSRQPVLSGTRCAMHMGTQRCSPTGLRGRTSLLLLAPLHGSQAPFSISAPHTLPVHPKHSILGIPVPWVTLKGCPLIKVVRIPLAGGHQASELKERVLGWGGVLFPIPLDNT